MGYTKVEKKNNYKILFNLRVLKSILTNFLDTFLVLYFLDVSESNILPLGIYKIVGVTAVFVTFFLARNYAKSKNRINLIRIGIVISFIYFSAIIFLKEKVIDYIYIIGLLYGTGEGFYYSVYNNVESDGISNEERPKFTGIYTAVKSILSIIFPLIFGTLIYATGFIKTLSIILVIAIIKIILSFFIKDRKLPKHSKTELKQFWSIAKDNKVIKLAYKNKVLTGLTYSEGAFSYIVTIYIIKVFSNSVSLGIFTSIFSLISCVLGIMFAKCIKRRHYNSIIKVSMTFTVITLCAMIYNCNFVTIVLFNLCQTFSKGLTDLITNNNASDISNLDVIKNKYKVEYWLGVEAGLFVGRIISNTLFILMAYTGADVMIYIFVIFLIMLASNSIKLQNTINEDEKLFSY